MTIDENSLRDLLHRAVPPMPGVEFDAVAGQVHASRRLPRGRVTTLAVLATAGAVVVLAFGLESLQSTSSPATQLSPIAPTDYQRLILRDGDHINATGLVVAIPGHPIQFCDPNVFNDLMPQPPAITECQLGVTAVGVNLETLAERRIIHGSTSGTATLTGIYRHGTITVTSQTLPNLNTHPPVPALTKVPCPAPPGGWPTATQTNPNILPVNSYEQAHPDTVVIFAVLRPHPDATVVYVLTNGDPTATRRALQDAYPDGLCVVRSRYNNAQLTAAHNAFTPNSPSLASAGITVVGFGGLDADEEPTVALDLMQVTPTVAALAAQQAPGLVHLSPWLVPQRS